MDRQALPRRRLVTLRRQRLAVLLDLRQRLAASMVHQRLAASVDRTVNQVLEVSMPPTVGMVEVPTAQRLQQMRTRSQESAASKRKLHRISGTMRTEIRRQDMNEDANVQIQNSRC